MENKEIKIKPLETKIQNPVFDDQENFNQVYIDDLIKLKNVVSEVPTFIPKKFIDQFQFFYDGADYKLYIYINNTWKSVILS